MSLTMFDLRLVENEVSEVFNQLEKVLEYITKNKSAFIDEDEPQSSDSDYSPVSENKNQDKPMTKRQVLYTVHVLLERLKMFSNEIQKFIDVQKKNRRIISADSRDIETASVVNSYLGSEHALDREIKHCEKLIHQIDHAIKQANKKLSREFDKNDLNDDAEKIFDEIDELAENKYLLDNNFNQDDAMKHVLTLFDAIRSSQQNTGLMPLRDDAPLLGFPGVGGSNNLYDNIFQKNTINNKLNKHDDR